MSRGVKEARGDKGRPRHSEFDFEMWLNEYLRDDPHTNYIDCEDQDYRGFDMLKLWRLKQNHYEYVEFDRQKLTAE